MMPTQSFPSVAKCAHRRYGSPVVAKSATGRGNPSNERRTSATSPLSGVFFTSATMLYGGCVWAGFGLAGFLSYRYFHPTHSRHPIPWKGR